MVEFCKRARESARMDFIGDRIGLVCCEKKLLHDENGEISTERHQLILQATLTVVFLFED